jgi:hypothetical protein
MNDISVNSDYDDELQRTGDSRVNPTVEVNTIMQSPDIERRIGNEKRELNVPTIIITDHSHHILGETAWRRNF